MQIKPNILPQSLQKRRFAIYWLAGQDIFLVEESLKLIKSHLKSNQECEEKIISIQATEDWRTVIEEANSYSLFSDATILNLIYDKKTLDTTGKKVISDYLRTINSRCMIIIRTPNLPTKQLSWLSSQNNILLVMHYSHTIESMNQWIKTKLNQQSFSFDADLPMLIAQHTQGNMLACAQVIEKISLCYDSTTYISKAQALEHLYNQCEHNLFELVDACLIGDSSKCIQIIRYVANNKTEVTLVLWMITQEIRQLIQLTHLIQSLDFKSACSQLRIWPQKAALYQSALKRLNIIHLQQLMGYCLSIDEQIKSSLNTQVWNCIERLSLSVCLGEPLYDLGL